MKSRNASPTERSATTTPPPRRVRGLSARDRRKAASPRLEGLEERRLLSFGPAASYPLGTNPQTVVTADFNGDARPDLAIGNHWSDSLSVLLGGAGGSFQAAPSSTVGFSPTSLAVGDFDADGKLDLAAVNFQNVQVLRGNGDGTFRAPATIDLGSGPSSVAVGDFNADGKLDLGVTSNSYYPGYSGPYGYSPSSIGRATVLLGRGDGSFSAPKTTTIEYGLHLSAAVADFNADGRDDFALTIHDFSSVVVLLANPDGALGSKAIHRVAESPASVVAGDVNGDGKFDLVTANNHAGKIGVLLGNGLGGFGPVQSFGGGVFPHSVELADFNGDGKTDVVTANPPMRAVNVMLGTGLGTFFAPVSATTGLEVVDVAVVDFNGDGRADVAAVNSVPGTVSVLLNDGIWAAPAVPTASIGDAQVYEGHTGTVAATFTVTLSSAYHQAVSVNYATEDASAVQGLDYQAAAGTLTFAPGQTTRTITVSVNGDRIGEAAEAFFVNLSGPTNVVIAVAKGTGWIQDDEPSIDVYGSGVMEGHSGTRPIIFTVNLTAPYDVPISVDFATANLTPLEETLYWPGAIALAGVDYAATSGRLVFAPGETTRTVEVPVLGDRISEQQEFFYLRFSNSAGLGFFQNQALGEITDDDPRIGIRIDGDVRRAEENSGTTPLTFSVSLSAAADVPVTVRYTTANGSALAGSDYNAASGTLTFAPGQTSRSLSVQVKGDTQAEANESFFIALSDPTNATIDTPSAQGIILDDDAPPRISISDAEIVEGNGGTRVMTFTVSLSKASSKEVRVDFATANGTAQAGDNDYASRQGTVVFAPGVTTRTITVSIKGDKKKESHERFSVNLSRATNGTILDAQGVGTIFNDDGGQPSSLRISAANVVIQNLLAVMPEKRRR